MQKIHEEKCSVFHLSKQAGREMIAKGQGCVLKTMQRYKEIRIETDRFWNTYPPADGVSRKTWQGAAVFLSSPASNYLSGHVMVVDGGWLLR